MRVVLARILPIAYARDTLQQQRRRRGEA